MCILFLSFGGFHVLTFLHVWSVHLKGRNLSWFFLVSKYWFSLFLFFLCETKFFLFSFFFPLKCFIFYSWIFLAFFFLCIFRQLHIIVKKLTYTLLSYFYGFVDNFDRNLNSHKNYLCADIKIVAFVWRFLHTLDQSPVKYDHSKAWETLVLHS